MWTVWSPRPDNSTTVQERFADQTGFIRYVLALRPEDLSQHLNSLGLDIDEDFTEEDSFEDSRDQEEAENQEGSNPTSGTQSSGIRRSYNIAPGYIEPVYLAAQKDNKAVRQLKPMKWG